MNTRRAGVNGGARSDVVVRGYLRTEYVYSPQVVLRVLASTRVASQLLLGMRCRFDRKTRN